jgi:hypothetical protein
VAQAFAGFICGYLLALASTPLLAMTLVRLRAGGGMLATLLPPGVSAISLSVILHAGLFFFWTAAGILLGLMLLAMDDSGSALASRNAAFSLFVAAVVLAIAAPVVIAVRSLRRVGIVLALLAVLVFGWLMPYMAEWSKFDDEESVPEEGVPDFRIEALEVMGETQA